MDLVELARRKGLIGADIAASLAARGASDAEIMDELRRAGLDEERLGELEQERSYFHMPRRLGGYEILEPLGSGGNGVVFKARQVMMARMVALKVLNPKHAARPGADDHLVQEARSAGAVNHPNVVTVYDVGEIGNRRYIAMEFMPLGDLAATMARRGGRLPEAEALDIAIDCCRGLGAIAAAGLVHCDIKPANVFIAAGRHAKLGDLGLARSLLDGPIGKRGGTYGFMPPEQLSPATRCDERSDVFALGATLYATLVGERPWLQDEPRAYLAAVRAGPPDPRLSGVTISAPTWRLIARSLAAERELRPDADAMLAELLAARSALLPAVSPGRQNAETVPTEQLLPMADPQGAGPSTAETLVPGRASSGARAARRRGRQAAPARRSMRAAVAVMALLGAVAAGVVLALPGTTAPVPASTMGTASGTLAEPEPAPLASPAVSPRRPASPSAPAPARALDQASTGPRPAPPSAPPSAPAPTPGKAEPPSIDPSLRDAAVVAYNDFVVAKGDPVQRIASIGPGASGELIDVRDGRSTGVSLAMLGGEVLRGRGRPPRPGTEAARCFDPRAIGLRGLISYQQVPIELRLDGLDPALRWEVVIYGNRAQGSYRDRMTMVALSGAEAFVNRTEGASPSSPTGVAAFGDNGDAGRVIRFADIDPGADRAVTLTIPAWNGQDQAGRYYLNALRLTAVRAR